MDAGLTIRVGAYFKLPTHDYCTIAHENMGNVLSYFMRN